VRCLCFRFVKRIYVPLPDELSREQLFNTLLATVKHSLHGEGAVRNLVERTAGYSGADIRSLCTEAAMGPVRDLQTMALGAGGGLAGLRKVSAETMPPISLG
jgi:SpoVK/Ycf46/Vps4 family AAA+-type ATPase